MKTLLLLLILSCPLFSQVTPKAPASSAATSVNVACGGDLQSAINSAHGETIITVAHLQKDGKTRCKWGSYALPWRPDNDFVTIKTDGALPAAGARTQPGDSYLALFVASATATKYYEVFYTALSGPSATPAHPLHGYRFIGLEMTAPNDTAFPSYGLLFPATYNITASNLSLADYPHGIDVQHCFIHGANKDQEIGRGISYSGNDLRVTDSYISEIHSTFIESNAIWGCPSTGNWTIENNDLQAAAENFFTCGGGEQNVTFASPKGLTFRYNYVHKLPEWRNLKTAAGGQYITKNLLELKGWDGAVIDSNLFEYSWVQSQAGFGILFTPRLDYSEPLRQPFLNHTVRNITFTNNTIRHVQSCWSIGVYDDNYASEGATQKQSLHAGGGATNFTITNNFCDDVSGATWGSGGPSIGFSMSLLAIPGETQNFNRNTTISHNTIRPGASPNPNSLSIQNNLDRTNPPCAIWDGPAEDMIITYNMFPWEIGRDCATGPTALMARSTFHHNTLAASYVPQDKWDAAFPGKKNLVNSKKNPDGRGANLDQLATLEAQIKAGKRPAAHE